MSEIEKENPSDQSGDRQILPDEPKPVIDPSSMIDAIEEKLSSEAPREESPKEPEGVQRKNSVQNTEIKLDPYSKGENKHRQEVLATATAPSEETFERLESVTKEEVISRANSKYWTDVMQAGLLTSSYNGAMDEILGNKTAKWVQHIKFGGFNIGPSASRATFEEGTVLTGAQALSATQRHLGLGGNFTTVLPHSGFWLTIKPPAEETIIELNRQYNNIKTEVGRTTYGLLLSSYNGLTNELFVRFALSSMVRNSIKDVDDILKMVSVHDIDNIIWAYICTMYPNGFNHRAACIADPTKCSHVEEDLINVRRLFFMNQNAFTEEQLKHLTSNSQSSMSVESVTKYREVLKERERQVIKVCEDTINETHFVLRVPSAYEYFDSTNRWINGIGTKVIEALGSDSSFNERNQLINEHANVTKMRQYSHWVEEIRVAGGIIKNREDIESNLDLMSTSALIREEFNEKVSQYIKDTRLSVIGVPDYKCQNCGKYQISEETTDPLNRSIVGLDVLHTFFIILVQRVQSAME